MQLRWRAVGRVEGEEDQLPGRVASRPSVRNRSSGTLLRMRGLEGHGFIQTPRRPWWVPCHWLGRKLKKAVDATPPIVSSIAGISSSRPTMLCDFDSSTSLILCLFSTSSLLASHSVHSFACFSSAVHTFSPLWTPRRASNELPSGWTVPFLHDTGASPDQLRQHCHWTRIYTRTRLLELDPVPLDISRSIFAFFTIHMAPPDR